MTDVVVMCDQSIQRPRGFRFVSFDIEDVVDRVLYKTFHDLNGKQVEVKWAFPKDANPSGGSHSMGCGVGRVAGGGLPPYGSSGTMNLAMGMVLPRVVWDMMAMVVKGMENGFVVFFFYLFVYSLRICLYMFGQ